MKVNIITSDPTVLRWKSLESKKKKMVRALSQMKNVGKVDINIILDTSINPKIDSEGRILHSYMESITKGYTISEDAFYILHFTMEQKERFKLQPNLRGLAYNDENFFSEAYFWADENTKRGKYNQFIETCLHEISHLIVRRSGIVDKTHDHHSANGTIVGIFKDYDYTQYHTGTLNKISSWLENKFGPQKLQPLVERRAKELIFEMRKLGYNVYVFEGYRSSTRQKELYSLGRTKPGRIVTYAKGGESLHNYGVAIDVVFNDKSPWDSKHPWKVLGKVGKSLGFTWGGDWKFQDLPHFELTLDYTLDDFKNGKVNYSRYV